MITSKWYQSNIEILSYYQNWQIANDERGKKSGLQQTVQTVERQLKTAHKKLSKHVEVALQHWRSSEHAASRRGGGTSGVGNERPKERPVVLRRRRQRVRAEGNWDLLFYQVIFSSLSHLIYSSKIFLGFMCS